MTRESRKKEALFIKNIINQFKGNVLRTPKNVHLEGGNIVIDRNNIFVGIGIRTTPNAIDFLKANFGSDYKIIPIAICEHEEIIHLDAIFNILDKGVALAYKKCLLNFPSELSDYKIIGITKQEKDSGGCNFLSIDKKIKIFRNDLKSLTAKVRKMGYTVEIASWQEIKKTGTTGPRCATLPLTRE
jgi:N-dimethylarginine dimethylaminohydrolase